MGSTQSVRPLNQQLLGMPGSNNLIDQILPAFSLIEPGTFRAGDPSNAFGFRHVPQMTGRLGIFAAEKEGVERAVMMLLPQSTRPDGVLICVTHGFQQAAATLDKLGWANPLSHEHVHYALLKHVINRWGLQTLASRTNLAFMYILRARGNELGPFARDGAFLRFVLEEIKNLTNNAFSYDTCEAFTFSSGIHDFNPFLRAAASHVNINAVYAIDPVHSMPAQNPNGGRRKMYASGTAGPITVGFEPMGMERWQNESAYNTPERNDRFMYLHNR
ncbi:MAG TPA: hypothetical protein VJL58_06505, partial [Pyrinomonadaceae bacterium]|nr:hypothetical protein [Pyrinomonadaceae bacterium]